MNLLEYPDRDLMMLDLASRLAGQLGAALRNQDRATLAVPGGTTPAPMFDALCAADLDWSRVDVLLTDERWLAEDEIRSNTRLVRKRLLDGRAAAATLVPMYAAGMSPEEAVPVLTPGVAAALPISVLLLGMGEDGHVAALFPGADRFEAAMAADAPPLVAMAAPGVPEPHVTLTLPVLQQAMSTHVLIVGRDKREALERARGLRPAEAPVAAILPGATVHWAE